MVYREYDVLGFLSRIRCPVLLIWASSTISRYKLRSTESPDPVQPIPSESEEEAQIALAKGTEGEEKILDEKSEPNIRFKGPAAKYFSDKKASTLKMNIAIIEKRMNSIEHLTTKVVEGHHHVHSDHPERVFDHIVGFLKKPQSKI